MLPKGNGTIGQCVNNLLQLIRGECGYERMKGINPRLIDQPSGQAAPELQADIQWVLENYEPRAELESVNLAALAAKVGDFKINTKIN